MNVKRYMSEWGISAYEENESKQEKVNDSSEDEGVTFLPFLTISALLGLVSSTSTMAVVTASSFGYFVRSV